VEGSAAVKGAEVLGELSAAVTSHFDSTLTTEQLAIGETVRDFMESYGAEKHIRPLLDEPSGYDREVWGQMAELGLIGVMIPESFGGAGLGPVEAGIIIEQLGHSLYPSPFLASAVLAGLVLRIADDATLTALAPSIASGVRIASALLSPLATGPDIKVFDDDVVLVGRTPPVIAGNVARWVFVAVDVSPSERVWAMVETDDQAVSIRPLRHLDLTRRFATLELRSARAPIVAREELFQSTGRVEAEAMTLLAQEQVGAMSAAIKSAAEYARTRIQFGRPIGSFQAVKHKCADMLIAGETSRSAAAFGRWATNGESDQVLTAGLLAHAYCSEAFVSIAKANIQVHGGIGFTWEHAAHLYLRRAMTDARLFGSPTQARERLAHILADMLVTESDAAWVP
jgi:alkylation response protein AidB-like acyl-CoA dehydrogenase